MLLEQYKQMAGMVKRMGGIKGLFGKGMCMDVVAPAGICRPIMRWQERGCV
jgi:hypothetical protein